MDLAVGHRDALLGEGLQGGTQPRQVVADLRVVLGVGTVGEVLGELREVAADQHLVDEPLDEGLVRGGLLRLGHLGRPVQHRAAGDGGGRFGLQGVPVLDDASVLDALDVEGDQRLLREAVIAAVGDDQVTFAEDADLLVAELLGQAGDERAQTL